MTSKLKIYACSGIGEAPKQRVQLFDYWTDNTNALDNTQATNGLIVDINLLMAEVNYIPTLTTQEVIDRLNRIDLLVVCMAASQSYAQHYAQLERAGRCIGAMLEAGMFTNSSLNNKQRDQYLDKLISDFERLMASGEEFTSPADFTQWFKENITDRNKIGLPANERKAMKAALTQAVSGIGKAADVDVNKIDWTKDADLGKYLSNAGTYFLYRYFTDEQLAKVPAKNRNKIKTKITKQNYTYNFCRDKFVGIYGSLDKYNNIIRTGIVEEFGAQPEQVCEDIAIGKRPVQGVGITTEVILAIISAVVAIVSALIAGICDAVAKSNAAKYQSLNNSIVEGGTPNPEDFDGMDMGKTAAGTTTAGSSSMLPLLLIGGAVALKFLKR